MRKEPKAFYQRQRPFERFNDSMPSHEEDELRGEGSYPSGHSLRGWGLSLLLAQIAPERANEIFKRGWDYGNRSVIVGAHWQSDVDAGRLIAAACVARLHADPDFRELMRQAKEEFLATQHHIFTEQPNVTIDRTGDDDALYTIDGRPATSDSHGVLVGRGKKVIVP
jgi:hypothetical protein